MTQQNGIRLGKHSKTLFIIFGAFFILSIASIYYRYVVLEQFEVFVEYDADGNLINIEDYDEDGNYIGDELDETI